ncbi:aspartate/glutamate racemase family protein [Antarctobacter sp.]|uniref:aspartate/glutamate racemase family protein n=1 Tax=Antarctobacter sp. TaxID=1872577 RepID=UPI002B2729CA|nr:aspartate/glutamate racemase family protein [Antarctobacter sp.]
MKIVYINPNATESMTRGIVATARQALPGVEIAGMTNSDGPAAIQGAEDGDKAVPGVLSRLATARSGGADAVVIACFDDTGLVEAQAQADFPVLGIGQASYVMASLLGMRFSVVTSLAVSIPVIEQNIDRLGFSGLAASVRASGLPVLTIDEGAPETILRIAAEVELARIEDGAACAVLGCAGMAPLKSALEARTGIPLIDGVAASAHLARAAVACIGGNG